MVRDNRKRESFLLLALLVALSLWCSSTPVLCSEKGVKYFWHNEVKHPRHSSDSHTQKRRAFYYRTGRVRPHRRRQDLVFLTFLLRFHTVDCVRSLEKVPGRIQTGSTGPLNIAARTT